MYTELRLHVNLKKNTPKEVMEILYRLVNPTMDHDWKPTTIIHPLFETQRWRWMFGSNSAYFDHDGYKVLRDHRLEVRFNIKNYDYEINKFLHWIMPYVSNSRDDRIGHYQYEESKSITPIFSGMTDWPVSIEN